MGLVTMWLGLELRRRWRSLLVLVLLVTISAGTVLTAVAGARRGVSAVDRLLAETVPATVTVGSITAGFDFDVLRSLPGVEALSVFVAGGYTIDGTATDDPRADRVAWPVFADREGFTTLERPLVLQGRLADPERDDEAVISPGFTERFGLGVGDTVTARLYAPETIDAINTGAAQLPEQGDGPAVALRIVGVVRSFWVADEHGVPGKLIPSVGLFTRYPGSFLGATGGAFGSALVRLRDGVAGIPAFRAELVRATGRPDIEVKPLAVNAEHTRQVLRFEAACLLAFALAALLAAAVLVGQAVARHVAETVSRLGGLSAVGMTRGQRVLMATAGPALAAAAGTALGVGATVLSSNQQPFGTAALVEPRPGLHADWLVLGVGWVLLSGLVAGGSVVAARVATAPPRPRVGRRSAVAALAARTNLPVPVAVGIRFALELDPRRGTLVRPPLLGAVVGVLGVLAGLTVAAGVADAGTHPERFGRTFQVAAYVGFSGAGDIAPADVVLGALAADPDVVGVTELRVASAESGGRSVTTVTYDPVGEPVPVVLQAGAGAMPAAPDEVVLGPTTAEALGARVGSTVSLAGDAGTATMTVTGLGFVPDALDNSYADGAWVTPQGYDRVFRGFLLHMAVVAVRPGLDPAGVAPHLREVAAEPAGGFPIPVLAVPPPQQLAEIREVQVLPLLLAAFLAVLAVGAIGQAVVGVVRRRRREIAVLRALGMTRPQCRALVLTQATVLAGAGLTFGIPLGIALGRAVWRLVADTTPLQYQQPVAFWTLVLIVPLALLVAVLLADRPGRRAVRLRIGAVLRAE